MTQTTNNLATALLLETPPTLALLMTSAAIFIGEIDTPIRKQLENKKMQLKHWTKLYHLSRSIHPYVIVTSALTAIASYHLTKEVTWLYGAATIATTIPLTLIAIKPTCEQLEEILDNTHEPQLPETLLKPVQNKLQSWIQRNRIRALLCLTSAGIFLLAKQYSC